MRPQVGDIVSHYQIVEKLGEGGMGVVYKAEHLKLGSFAALKFLNKEASTDSVALKRFIREAKAASRLEHPNIAAVHDFDETQDGQSFLVMSYFDGDSLRARMAEKMDLPEAVAVTAQVASGLLKAHRLGVIHRDIKPENIHVTTDGTIKILDFGIAALAGQTTITEENRRPGTLLYMSPEQAGHGDKVDHRSDIFSLGVVLYEMLTGAHPFMADHQDALIYRILHEDADPVSKYRPDLPPEVEQVLMKALAKEAEHRYDSCAEFIENLQALVPDRPLPVPSWVEPPSRPRLPRWLVAAVPVAATIAALLVWVSQRGPAESQSSVAVLYFEDLTGSTEDRRLGSIITNLLITDLSQSDYVKVTSSQRLHDILKRTAPDGGGVLDKSSAVVVAQEAGVSWMVLGSIIQEEPFLVTTSQLVDVRSGDVRDSQRLSSKADESVFSHVDRLSSAIKQGLPLPPEALEEPELRVADVTTESREAYGHYVEGLELLNAFNQPAARAAFQKALIYDSTFAMAHLRYAQSGPMTRKDRKDAVDQAVRYASKASPKEQEFIHAYDALSEGNIDSTIARLEVYVEHYPDDKGAIHLLGNIYAFFIRDPHRAIENHLRVIELDPLDAFTYNALAYRYNDIGEVDKSIEAITKYIELSPDDPNPRDSAGDIYAYNGDLENAAESYREALKISPDYVSSLEGITRAHIFLGDYSQAADYAEQLLRGPYAPGRASGRLYKAIIPAFRGRFEESLQQVQAGIKFDDTEGFGGYPHVVKHAIEATLHAELGQTAEALQAADEFRREITGLSPHNPVFDRYFSALDFQTRIAADLEQWDAAQAAIDSLGAYLDVTETLGPERVAWAEAWVNLRRDDAAAAVSGFERPEFRPEVFSTQCGMGYALSQTDQTNKAIAVLEKALVRYTRSRVFDPILSVKSYYELGRVSETAGRNDTAIEHYETFLALWGDVGTDEVQDAESRLAALRK